MTTQLPEPNFIERDADKITQEWITLYEEKTGKKLQPAQIERILIDVGVYRENLLRIKIQEAAKSNLLNYAPLDILLHLGELVGVERLLAEPSQTTIKFAVETPFNYDIVIPEGTGVETFDGKYTFATTEDCVIVSGATDTTVLAKCTITGSESNGYEANKVITLTTPIDEIAEVTNIDSTYGGGDDEDVESLRERIRLAPESFSNAGSKGAYRFHTFSAHSSIKDVAVISPSAGVVEIYPLTNTGNPDTGLIQIISDYLNQNHIRPLTDLVQVKPPQRVEFTINAVLYLYLDADMDAVQTMVQEKLQEYKDELASKLGKDIVPSQIITILNSIYGVYKVELETPTYQIVSANQWADLINTNVTFGGYADE